MSNKKVINHLLNESMKSKLLYKKTNICFIYVCLILSILITSIVVFLSVYHKFSFFNTSLIFFFYMFFIHSIQYNKEEKISLCYFFSFSSFIGLIISGLIRYYIFFYSNSSNICLLSFFSSIIICLFLSLVSLNPNKNYSFFNNFVGLGSFFGLLVVFSNLYFKLSLLGLILSIIIFFVSILLIIWQFNEIVICDFNNAVILSATIYVSFLNIFLVNLQFFSFFMGIFY